MYGYVDRSAEDDREGEWHNKEPQAGSRTQGRCHEDIASVHGTPALPTELNGA